MRLIRYLDNYPKTPCVLTIGNFDGVHCGHQALLTKLEQLASQYHLPSVVMSFSPTPKAFFGIKQTQINNFRERFNRLAQYKINTLLLLNFNQALANLDAQTFVADILIKQLNIKHILIGDDFVFGKNRTGNQALLEKFGQQYHFNIHQLPSIKNNNVRISSSLIRQALAQGDFGTASEKLGYHFKMSGKIIYGEQKGRTIDFPTINIAIKRSMSPIFGVFAVRIHLNNTDYEGVANIGNCPTMGNKNTRLEVFIFDFNQMVYGQIAQITFCAKIRDEQHFKNFDALKTQIQHDVQWAKTYFLSS